MMEPLLGLVWSVVGFAVGAAVGWEARGHELPHFHGYGQHITRRTSRHNRRNP